METARNPINQSEINETLITPCARTNCYPLLPVTRIRCAKTGVTRVGVIQ